MERIDERWNDVVQTRDVSWSPVAAQRVLRNTYILLAMTLAFSAVAAWFSMTLNLPHPGVIITLVGYFGLLFMVQKLANRASGILAVFALTGFMGYTLGPILTAYLALPHGPAIVMQAFGGTAAIFLGLSVYAAFSKRDFSFLGGMLFAGMLVAFFAGIGALLFHVPALSLAVSAMVVLLMSGMILFETSQIVRGGETNYILATVSLYVTLFNLFTSLLQLLGVVGGSED